MLEVHFSAIKNRECPPGVLFASIELDAFISMTNQVHGDVCAVRKPLSYLLDIKTKSCFN